MDRSSSTRPAIPTNDEVTKAKKQIGQAKRNPLSGRRAMADHVSPTASTTFSALAGAGSTRHSRYFFPKMGDFTAWAFQSKKS
jgi:hypothetical protein